jgi:hypothetical protein
MLNTFSGWLCNVLLLGAIAALIGLSYEVFVGPVLSSLAPLVALIVVLVASLFWPKL